MTSEITIYRRILAWARPWWPHLAGILALSLLATPIALLAPLPVKIALDHVVAGQPLPGFLAALLPAVLESSGGALLATAAALVVLVALLRQLQGSAVGWLQTHTSQRMLLAFRSRLFAHAQRLSLAFHDERGTADAIYRIQWDAPSIQNIAVSGVIPFITSTFTVVMMIWVMTRIDFTLAAIALAVAPALFFLTRGYRRPLRRRYAEVRQLETSALGVVQQAISSLRVVKAFGGEEREHERFLGHSGKSARARTRLALFQGLFDLLLGLTTAIGTALVLWFGARHVQSGTLTIGELYMVLAYLAQLYAPLRTMSAKIGDIQGSMVGAERAFALLDQEHDVPEKPDARRLERAAGAIEFRDVSFDYGSGRPVLRHVEFSVPAGARVGISGRTGSGKSTLVNLLTRLYDPQEGAILLDGVDLRDLRLADLRAQFAIVLQEPVLFSTSIAENIGYARPGATMEEIEEAARAAGVHEFIAGLPEGYATGVGERGMMLSGGERQRISLARAFLKDAPILILDEPTSSVDTATETAILAAMERLMRGRTAFMIAHRLSTLDRCDVRLEVADGHVRALAVEAAAVSS